MAHEWKPGNYHKDPMVNAVLNVARELASLSHEVGGLLYALKYGRDEGLSVAEAIEKGCELAGDKIASAIESAADSYTSVSSGSQ